MNLKSIAKKTLRLIYTARKTNLGGITFKEADTVVWVKIWGLSFFSEDDFVFSMGIINALSQSGVKFNVRFTTKIGKFRNKKVYFAYSRGVDPYRFSNYT